MGTSSAGPPQAGGQAGGQEGGPDPWLSKRPGSKAIGDPLPPPSQHGAGAPSRALAGRPPLAGPVPPPAPSAKSSPPTPPAAAPVSHSTLFSEPFVTAPSTKARERKKQGVGKGRKIIITKKKNRKREQEGKKEGGQGVKRARSVAERGGGEIMK